MSRFLQFLRFVWVLKEGKNREKEKIKEEKNESENANDSCIIFVYLFWLVQYEKCFKLLGKSAFMPFQRKDSWKENIKKPEFNLVRVHVFTSLLKSHVIYIYGFFIVRRSTAQRKDRNSFDVHLLLKHFDFYAIFIKYEPSLIHIFHMIMNVVLCHIICWILVILSS